MPLDVLLLLAVAMPPGSQPSAAGLDGRPEHRIDWIRDDFPAALADARRNRRPVFVDVWASWCHTCISMQNFVLVDDNLQSVRTSYTWLALDFDQPVNTAFFEKFPVNAVPTLFIIDGEGAVLRRRIGAGRLEEILEFLAPGRATDPLAQAEALLASGKHRAAYRAFARLLPRSAKTTDARRVRLWAGLIESLWGYDKAECARLGRRALDAIPPSGGSIEAFGILESCIAALPLRRRRALETAMQARLEAWANDPNLPVSTDDRSTLLGLLVDVSASRGDLKAKRTYLLRRRVVLEEAAAAATTAASRATYDDHRMEVYMQLKELPRAVRMLEASEAAQPEDFNHPWRLAKVYLAQQNIRQGLAAVERALEHGYGGRKIRLYSTKLDLLIADERWAEARATVAAARRELERWPRHQVRPSWRREFEERASKVASRPG